jgi:hypothetical protein
LNVAVTEDAAFTVSVQLVCVPVHAPDHPAKTLLTPTFAYNVTVVPGTTASIQALGQPSCPSFEPIVPCPDPAVAAVRLMRWEKFATTTLGLST